MRKKKDLTEALARKTIAVSSGKGGVGKTTTAVNLAIYYAKKNLRVGLIDLDPLSDIATLLDLEEPEAVLTKAYDARKGDLASHVKHLFDNLDLIFPFAKLQKQDSLTLMEKLYLRFTGELNRAYDLIVLDLPAGMRYEDNMVFLRHADHLVLVTQAEPTAHVSAGGYLKSVLEQEPDITVHLWHNKFNRAPGQTFHPSDVIGNYNRNVPPEERMDEAANERVADLAFIPSDAALDLLQTHPSPRLNLMRSILDLSEFFQERRLQDLARDITLSPRLFDILKYFLLHTEKIASVSDYLDSFGAYLKKVITNDIVLRGDAPAAGKLPGMSGLDLFTKPERSLLERYLTRVKVDAVLLLVNRLIVLLEKAVVKEEGRARDGLDYHKPLDAAIGRLLLALNVRKNEMGPDIRHAGGLMLFYFSLYKLFQSRSVLDVIVNFIPRRKNSRGKIVRDKNRQIGELVRSNREYEGRYFKLIKTLYPVINRQVSTVVDTFKLQNLLLKDKHGQINKVAYLTLFANFMHETVNSGLSVIVGFKHRPAAKAFVAGAEALLDRMNNDTAPAKGRLKASGY